MTERRAARGAVANTWTLVHVALLVVLLVLRGQILQFAPSRLSMLVALVSGGTLVRTIAAAPRKMWSPSSVLFLVLFLFHCGLAVAYSFGPLPEDAMDLRTWFWRRETKAALWLVLLGMVAFSVGVSIARTVPPAPSSSSPKKPDLDNDTLSTLGALLTVFAVALWFGNAVSKGGLRVLVGSYNYFLDTSNTSMALVAYYGMAAGIVLAASSRWTRWHRVTWVAFGLFALVGLPIGLRSEILFPLAGAVGVVGSRGMVMRSGRAVILAVVVLAGISVVRQMRQVGIGSLEVSSLKADPRDGLIELGASLRPVQQVVIWHKRGEKFANGATYWAPVDRMLYYVIPGWTRPPIELDDRMMSVVIAERAGPIGFSMVAEAFHNFGEEGVIVVLAAVGFLFGRIDHWPSTRRRQIWAGTLLLAALSHVRNPFIGVPVTMIVGIVVNLAAAALARAVSDRRARSVQATS